MKTKPKDSTAGDQILEVSKELSDWISKHVKADGSFWIDLGLAAWVVDRRKLEHILEGIIYPEVRVELVPISRTDNAVSPFIIWTRKGGYDPRATKWFDRLLTQAITGINLARR